MSKDDILDDDLFGVDVDGETETSSTSTEEEVIESDSGAVPSLIGRDYPESYKNAVERFVILYKQLPKLDYNAIHAELASLNADSGPTPTLQLINLKLQKIQAYKDRLEEIHNKVVRAYYFKKRAVSVMTEAWGNFADGTSADKRKAEAAFRLSDFHADFAQTEALYYVCENVLKNLDSQSMTVSRQITVIQSQLKMFDMGRGALPDFDFNKSSLNEGFESLGDPITQPAIDQDNASTVIDISKSIDAEELSF